MWPVTKTFLHIVQVDSGPKRRRNADAPPRISASPPPCIYVKHPEGMKPDIKAARPSPLPTRLVKELTDINNELKPSRGYIQHPPRMKFIPPTCPSQHVVRLTKYLRADLREPLSARTTTTKTMTRMTSTRRMRQPRKVKPRPCKV